MYCVGGVDGICGYLGGIGGRRGIRKRGVRRMKERRGVGWWGGMVYCKGWRVGWGGFRGRDRINNSGGREER
jgi:hypothetical protein